MADNEELHDSQSESNAVQKILVADDEASIRRILETRLKMVGYDVVVAEDGEEAVEVFNKSCNMYGHIQQIIALIQGLLTFIFQDYVLSWKQTQLTLS